jgi:hypothetical protein
MNICIRRPGTNNADSAAAGHVIGSWTSSVSHVTPAFREAYSGYKYRPHYYQEIPYVTREYVVYRPENDPYLPTYIVKLSDIESICSGVVVHITREIHDRLESTGRSVPIMDLNDVSVFIVDNRSVRSANWLAAREYQVWAYRDFMYDHHRSIKKSYMSRGSNPIAYNSNDRILANQIVTIDVPDILPNIVFNISRNDNNSVYFERNDEVGSRVRICDNQYARSGYLGFYMRITMDPGFVVMPPHPLGAGAGDADATHTLHSITHLHAPEETDDEERQCILCFKFRINARFSPCEHKVCCSSCYSKMAKNECPVCRAEITQVMNT